MQHLRTREQTKATIRAILTRIDGTSVWSLGQPTLTLGGLIGKMRGDGTDAGRATLFLTALMPFVEVDSETEALSIRSSYGHVDPEALTRMVWQQMLAQACAQHPAHS